MGQNHGKLEYLSRKTGHDLKNIFGTLIANTELLLEVCAGREEEEERLKRMLAACSRGVTLIERIREDQPFDDILTSAQVKKSAHHHLLVVEDDTTMNELIARMLQGKGYQVTTCTHARTAFAVFLENPQGIDLVLTDQVMPEISGTQLLEEIHAIRSDMPCILMTGDGEITLPEKGPFSNCILLGKPVQRAALFAAVAERLAGNGEKQ